MVERRARNPEVRGSNLGSGSYFSLEIWKANPLIVYDYRPLLLYAVTVFISRCADEIWLYRTQKQQEVQEAQLHADV